MTTTRRRRLTPRYEKDDEQRKERSPGQHMVNSIMKYNDDKNCNPKPRKNNFMIQQTPSCYRLIIISMVLVTTCFTAWQLNSSFIKRVEAIFNLLQNAKKKEGRYFRTISISSPHPYEEYDEGSRNGSITLDPMLFVNRGEETAPQEAQNTKLNSCVPMEKWQTHQLTTCNLIHEIDLLRNLGSDNNTKIIGNGWFRDTWKIKTGLMNESYVLKTLRYERDFQSEYYELHRRESMAMERLTKSPYIVDIFSFCAQTSINEYANFIDGFQDLRSFAKQLRGNNDYKVLRLKLQITTMIALGVQHIHEVDSTDNATLVHYDINPKNIIIKKGGIPKINDFNLAQFMYWDKTEHKRCGFVGRFNEPWWRSPEEIRWSVYNTANDSILEHMPPLLDEKVDIYSLGNIIYVILTGHSPRGRVSKDPHRFKRVAMDVLNGLAPSLNGTSTDIISSDKKLPLYSTMKNTMKKCFEPEPTKRSSGRQIAQALLNALNGVERQQL